MIIPHVVNYKCLPRARNLRNFVRNLPQSDNKFLSELRDDNIHREIESRQFDSNIMLHLRFQGFDIFFSEVLMSLYPEKTHSLVYGAKIFSKLATLKPAYIYNSDSASGLPYHVVKDETLNDLHYVCGSS